MDYSLRGYPQEQFTIVILPSEKNMAKKLEEVAGKFSGNFGKVSIKVKIISPDETNASPKKLEKYFKNERAIIVSTDGLNTRKLTNLDFSKYETKDKPVRALEKKESVVEEVKAGKKERAVEDIKVGKKERVVEDVKAGKKEEPAPVQDVRKIEDDTSTAPINRIRAPERAIRRLERLAALQDINFVDEAHPENAINFEAGNVEALDESEYEALAKEVNEIFSGIRAPEEEEEKKEKKEVKEREMVRGSHGRIREPLQGFKGNKGPTVREAEINYLQQQGTIEKNLREKARETREKDKKRRREDIERDDLKREIRTGEVNKVEKESAAKRSEINKGAR